MLVAERHFIRNAISRAARRRFPMGTRTIDPQRPTPPPDPRSTNGQAVQQKAVPPAHLSPRQTRIGGQETTDFLFYIAARCGGAGVHLQGARPRAARENPPRSRGGCER